MTNSMLIESKIIGHICDGFLLFAYMNSIEKVNFVIDIFLLK